MFDIKAIDSGILRYRFTANQIPRVSHAVYVLVSGDRAVVIDPSYRENARVLRDELAKEGITVTDVIISHGHPDHCEGVLVFDEVRIWGVGELTPFGQEYTEEEVRSMLSNQAVCFGQAYRINEFSIRFFPGRGHLDSGMLTEINGVYLHTNDLLCYNEAGIPVLPLVFDNVAEYRRSLESLQQHPDYNLLLPHLSGGEQGDYHAQIRMNLRYLQALEERGSALSEEDVTKLCGVRYDYISMHGSNLEVAARTK